MKIVQHLSKMLVISWTLLPGILLTSQTQAKANFEKLAQNPPRIVVPQSQKVAPQPIYRVPIIRRSSGVPVVNVSFNKENTEYPLLLDTAASVTVISRSTARKVKWEQTGTVQADLSSGERITLPIGKVPSIQVGGTHIENFVTAVGPVPLLGANFHSKFTMLITPTQILLRPNTTNRPEQRPTRNSTPPNL